MPPATTTSAAPAAIMRSATCTAASPDRHALLSDVAGTSKGTPAATAAWRAGTWPWPAWSTCPITTAPTALGSSPARASAPEMATAPRSIARTDASAPPIFPISVRGPPRISDPATAPPASSASSLSSRSLVARSEGDERGEARGVNEGLGTRDLLGRDAFEDPLHRQLELLARQRARHRGNGDDAVGDVARGQRGAQGRADLCFEGSIERATRRDDEEDELVALGPGRVEVDNEAVLDAAEVFDHR